MAQERMSCAHYFQAPDRLACSRPSDSGEDAKEKVTQKVGGAGKRFLPFYFRVSAFLIHRTRLGSGPGTGYC